MEQQNYFGEDIHVMLRERLIACTASDEVFEEKLRGPVYDENVGVTRFILCKLAGQGMTVETEKDLWRTTNSNQYVWTIEHIFPQGTNIPESWVNMIADGNFEKAREYQAIYVHTFGNLSITGYNSTLGNKSFEEKKECRDNNGAFIGYRNGLNLNADLCNKERWTIDTIKERTEKLVMQISDIFRL